MKIALIVIDGLGDGPIKKLGGKTPLEAARTPNLYSLAEKGMCGLIKTFYFPWQKYPRSDTAHLALFGYQPQNYYLGRGPYEAAGLGLEMKEGEVAFRANFGTVDKNLKILNRRAGRINNKKSLVKAISRTKIGGVKFLVKDSWGHRAVLILKGNNISGDVSDGDSKEIGKKVRKIVPLKKSKSARFTAKVLNEFLEKTHLILENHPQNKKRKKSGFLPANYFLIRGGGKLKETPSFFKKYRLKAGCIAAGYLYRGVAKILGMQLINVKGATGGVNTNLKGKMAAIKRNLKKYDFIFCHIKATDSLAEDGDFMGKKKFIERIDRELKTILNLKNTLLVVTADHSTCSDLKRHCILPVPVLISGAKTDSVKKFSERDCKKGQLGQFPQLKLMSKILKYGRMG